MDKWKIKLSNETVSTANVTYRQTRRTVWSWIWVRKIRPGNRQSCPFEGLSRHSPVETERNRTKCVSTAGIQSYCTLLVSYLVSQCGETKQRWRFRTNIWNWDMRHTGGLQEIKNGWDPHKIWGEDMNWTAVTQNRVHVQDFVSTVMHHLLLLQRVSRPSE